MGIVIGVDFDGTCVTHEYPKVGQEIGASYVLRLLTDAGHKIILNTMRSHSEGEVLNDAINWFKKHNIPLYGVNENPTQKEWTSSPKPYANLYIDDAALGCPLCTWKDNERPFVNWLTVLKTLVKMGLIDKKEVKKVHEQIESDWDNMI